MSGDILDKSKLRRLVVQIPKREQGQFLANTFGVDVLKEALFLCGIMYDEKLECVKHKES